MSTVRQLLQESTVADVGPVPAPQLPGAATLQQVLQVMARARRGALVVVDESRPIGVFTERDVLRRIDPSLFGSATERNRVAIRDLMSSPVVTIRRRAALREAVDLMNQGGHRHLVVTGKEGNLLGLLTTNDIIHFVTDHFPEDTVNVPPHLHQRYAKPAGE